MCGVDAHMIIEEEDEEEDFWHCAGLERGNGLKISAVMDADMADVGGELFEKVQAWRDGI